MNGGKKIRKILVDVLGPIACRIKRPAPPKNLPALIMTLLVRNEADIVRANIDFHFRMGVDHIFVTDNGSVDGTREILKEYESTGRLTVIDEPGRNFNQAVWVNRMADMAFARFGKCLIFHCDADEFWHCASGNLKHELSSYPWVDCLKVTLLNVLLLHRNFEERFPDDAVAVVHKPFAGLGIANDRGMRSFYLIEYPKKVMFRAGGHMPHVEVGNDRLIDRKTYVTRPSGQILIYHFPLRGFGNFERKVMEGGSAIVSNPDLSPKIGWQWRKWYREYLDGHLRETYRDLVLDEKEADMLEKQGVLKINPEIRNLCFPSPLQQHEHSRPPQRNLVRPGQ